MSVTTIGTCSLCGGAVQVPQVWMGITPPTPTCANCGARAAQHGPVIPMQPRPREDEQTRARERLREQFFETTAAPRQWSHNFGVYA